jgi:hypothetical protein
LIVLRIVEGTARGRVFELDEPVIGLGRAETNNVAMPDYHLSGEHGQIFAEGDHYVYRDLRSTNGSAVQRGEQMYPIDAACGWEITLHDGDERATARFTAALSGGSGRLVPDAANVYVPTAAPGGRAPHDENCRHQYGVTIHGPMRQTRRTRCCVAATCSSGALFIFIGLGLGRGVELNFTKSPKLLLPRIVAGSD